MAITPRISWRRKPEAKRQAVDAQLHPVVRCSKDFVSLRHIPISFVLLDADDELVALRDARSILDHKTLRAVFPSVLGSLFVHSAVNLESSTKVIRPSRLIACVRDLPIVVNRAIECAFHTKPYCQALSQFLPAAPVLVCERTEAASLG